MEVWHLNIGGGYMEKLADAVVYAVAYINCSDEAHMDDDVNARESVSHIIGQASDDELNALAAAAKRALAEELAAPLPRDSWVECYSTWMEDLFGGEGWIGNDRDDTGTQ
jgi:hypothetical protein